MQKAIPIGPTNSQSSTRSPHTQTQQTHSPRTGGQSGLAQLAALANSSSRVQAQLKMSDELRNSAQVETQLDMAEKVNAASPVAAQLKRLEEKKPAQPKGMKDEKKLAQPKFDAAAQAVRKEEKRPAQTKLKDEKKPRQPKFAAGAETAQLEQAPSPNHTGLPDQLKTGVEGLSGVSLDNVKVHYNSAKPAQLNALAYAQGTDIHVGPGQEKHLPHETWHVVQQHEGRVKPTTQAKGVAINDDSGLEQEADVMGAKATAQRRTGRG
jgi:hypothetical protein